MSLLDRINACHHHDITRFRPFLVDGQQVGFMRSDLAEELKRFPSVFRVEQAGVRIARHLDTFDYRSAAIDSVMRELRQEGFIRGWRDEYFSIAAQYGAEPLFDLERAGVPLF